MLGWAVALVLFIALLGEILFHLREREGCGALTNAMAKDLLEANAEIGLLSNLLAKQNKTISQRKKVTQ
jgi:hypothetical protein